MAVTTKQIKHGKPVKLSPHGRALVVGCIITPGYKLPPASRKLPCDVVEMRLDQMPTLTDWLVRGQRIESRGVPVIVTIRHKSEGGDWRDENGDRVPLYGIALEHLSAVDVELQSDIARKVAALAKKRGKCCIVSFHDFKKTPPLAKLKRVASQAQRIGSIIKIVTMANTEADVDTLRQLLACKWKKPLCVMGMGSLGRATRIEFPSLGSCLSYGYLDKPAAPGQLSASEITRRLSRQTGRVRRT